MISAGRTVTLVDGRVVRSDSREWQLECLARHVLTKPLAERRLWLEQYEKRHGPIGANELKAAMTALHQKARAA